jgi:hypothetical protein
MTGDGTIRRARPQDLARLSGTPGFSSKTIAARFCDYSYLLLEAGGKVRGLLGWDIGNLVACLADLQVADPARWADCALALIHEAEAEAQALRGEVAILFLPGDLPATAAAALEAEGYVAAEMSALVAPWREAAKEHIAEGQRLWVKRLSGIKTEENR